MGDRRASRPAWWACFAFLVVLGLGLRLPGLGELSFYGDEETTALAARSLAEEGIARMPSGMEYRRALPYTWLAAGIAARMGTDREEAYRLVPAILGGLTPAALFAAGVTFVGMAPAFVAGVLLATSEWHVAFSRIARMYAPFLLFYVLSAWWLWRWGTSGDRKYAWLGAGAGAATLSLHYVGVTVVLFVLLPLAFRGAAVVATRRLLAFAAITGGAGLAYGRFFVTVPYRVWGDPEAVAASGPAAWLPRLPTIGSPLYIGLAILASIVFAFLALQRLERSRAGDAGGRTSDIVMVFAVSAAFGLALVGQLVGAASLVAVGLVAGGREFLRMLERQRLWLGIAAGVAIAWLLVMVAGRGIYDGLKSVGYFPYPYAAWLALEHPVIILLAAGATAAAVFGGRARVPARAAALSVAVPLLGLGIVSRWGAPRYYLHVYPFLLLLAGLGLVGLIGWLFAKFGLAASKRRMASAAAAVALAASGLLGSHGLPDAVSVLTLRHGEPTDPALHMTRFRPDHESPGIYVRERAAEDDIVIAVDALQQVWYVGRVDYWLRSEGDADSFVYRDDGEIREFYASTRLLRSREQLDRVLAGAGERRVWLTTSGEIAADDEYALDAWQRDLLTRLAESGRESFVGRDGVTKVYCLNCPAGG